MLAFGCQGWALLFLLAFFQSSAQAAVFHPHLYTLANGLQVVIVPGALSSAVTQMVWYKVGSTDDPVGKSGLAHYLEHMMFKGTDSLPSGAFSKIIAAEGGSDNAFTSYDYTAYTISIAADRLPLVMQMEADRMRHLRFSPEDAAQELSVVLSERQERTDNSPQGLFFETLRAALFGKHPYGRPVIGWRKEIETITPEAARDFYRRFYAPNNAILVVNGDVDSAKVLSLAAATFGRLPPEKDLVRTELPSLPFSHKQERIERKDSRVNQPFFIRQIVAPSGSDALDVLAEVLTGSEVGLLYRHFVLEKKTASGISVSYNPTSRGEALFSLAATPSPDVDVRLLEKDVEKELVRLARRGLSAKDVEAAKKRLEDAALFARDSLSAPAEVLGETLVVGQKMDAVEKWPTRIHALTPQSVNEAFRALLGAPYQVRGLLEPEGKAP